LEAVSEKKLEIKIPVAYQNFNRSEVDWAFFVQNLRNNWTGGNSIFQEQETLGGSSSTNHGLCRGNKANPMIDGKLAIGIWDYESVLPYFKKSAHNEDIHTFS